MNAFETTLCTKLRGSLFLIVVALAFSVTACDLTDGFDEDPNQPGDATGELVLNSTEVATILYHEGDHARITSFWTEQLDGSDRQYAGQDRPQYNLTATDVNNLWITGYADAIGDLTVVEEKAQAAGNDLLLGIAQTLKALNFGTTAALHGDVPYSEVAQGNDNLNPAFDPQLEIYDQGVIQALDTAIVNLESGGISPGNSDVFYGGDADSWIEAANTVQARYMLHVAHVDQEPVGQYTFEDVYQAAQDGISDPSGDLIAPHGEALNVNANTFWQFRNDRGDDLTAQGSYAARLLDENTNLYRGDSKTDEAGRFDFYFVGDDPAYDMAGNESTDNVPGRFYSRGADYPIVTYVENELIKAEAAVHSSQRSLSEALTALNNAREANETRINSLAANDSGIDEVTYEDYELDDFAQGGIANNGNESQAEALLREILEEKYVSLISNIEAYADLRRTENYIGVQDSDGDVITMEDLPQRFPIAQSEVTGNENVPDPIPSIQTVTPANEATYPTP